MREDDEHSEAGEQPYRPLLDFDAAWDRKMESDAAAGKLDFLVQEADEAASRGLLRDWPGEHA